MDDFKNILYNIYRDKERKQGIFHTFLSLNILYYYATEKCGNFIIEMGALLIVIQKSVDEMKAIFGTSRMDSIKRSMQSAGIDYKAEGRGGSAVYTFTEPQSVLKLLLISDYGFTPNRSLDKACELFKGYILGYRPYARMFKKDIAEMLDICADTVSRWIQNYYASGLLAKGIYDDTIPAHYCTSFKVNGKRYVAEITEEQYLQAKARYSAVLTGGGTTADAIKAYHSVTGGNVYAQRAERINGFNWNPLFDEIAAEIKEELEEISNGIYQ